MPKGGSNRYGSLLRTEGTHVYVPLELFPQRPHECTKIDVLEAIHKKSAFGISQGQLLDTLTNPDTGQLPTDKKILSAVTDSGPAQPIKLEEIADESCEHAKNYMGKKKLIDSQVPRREFQPVRKLWVLNTRFKSVRRRYKLHWKGPYLITKIHSHKRVNLTVSTSKFQCISVKHQHIPYLLSPNNAAKGWLILREQVTRSPTSFKTV